MTNAFVAALLKVAGEHRLKAESARNLISEDRDTDPSWWRAATRLMNDSLEKDAREDEGLAEVYERFAHKIISEVAGQLILEQFERMSGDAALEFEPDLTPGEWRRAWYDMNFLPPLPPLPPFTIIGLN